MKHDPDLYAAVVSGFFTDEMIKHIEDMMNIERPSDSSVNLMPEIELEQRMGDFVIEYSGFEKKKTTRQKRMKKSQLSGTFLKTNGLK